MEEDKLAGAGGPSQTSGTHCSLLQAIGLQRHAERKMAGLCFIFGFCQIKRIWETGRAIMLKCRVCQVDVGLFISNSI